MTQIIGFTGRKGSGKDTAANALDGFENVKMAGALKAMLGALLSYQGAEVSNIRAGLEGDLKELPWSYLGGKTPRHAMQTLGTEWGRQMLAEDLWIRAAERRISLFDKVVISDIRFPNEVEMVRRLGGKVYRIVRSNLSTEDAHPSEALIDYLDVDGAIYNCFATPEGFAAAVRALIATTFRDAWAEFSIICPPQTAGLEPADGLTSRLFISV